MMRGLLCLAGLSLTLVVFAQGAQEVLPLTRGEGTVTNSIAGTAGTNTADMTLARMTNTRPGDSPAGSLKGKIRLPPTIINIEDLSEMRLERDMTLRLLLPEIERARLRLDEPGRDPGGYEADGRTNRRGRSGGVDGERDGSGPEGSGGKHVLSTFEITYGFHDTLGAMVSTDRKSVV